MSAFGSNLTDQQAADLKAVMASTAGRAFVHWVIYGVCDLEGDEYPDKVHDGECAGQFQARRNGQRSVGRALKDEAKEHAREQWDLLRREADNRETTAFLAAQAKTKRKDDDHDD